MPEMTPERIAEIEERLRKLHASPGGPTLIARELLAEVERLRAEKTPALADNELDGEMMETIIRLKAENADLRAALRHPLGRPKP